MSERDQGERAGVGPGHRRPSRRMRERADEMADLLALAAPSVRERRRRRSVGIPAAVVALGALTVGGVGVAVGLDAEPADTAIALPADPSGPPGPDDGAGAAGPGVRVTTSAVADVPVGEDETGDRADAGDGRAADRDAAGGVPDPEAGAGSSDAPARRPAPPRPQGATTTTSAPAGVSPREATSSTSPGSDSGPTRSTSTPTGERDEDASDDRRRSGRGEPDSGTDGTGGGSDGATDLRADSRGTSAVLPSRSPTGDDG